MKKVTSHPEIKKHIRWAQRKKYCTQCIYPWYDGMCECGGMIHEGSERFNKVSELAFKLKEKGWDLN